MASLNGMMLRKRKQPRRSCRSNPSQQLQQTPPRTVVNDNTACQSDASTSRRDDASSSGGAVDNNNSSALPPLAPRDDDDDSVCSDRDADDIDTPPVSVGNTSPDNQRKRPFEDINDGYFLLSSHGTDETVSSSSHRCSRSSPHSDTLAASSYHIYDDEVEDHFSSTKKTKWTVDTCPNCFSGCLDCTPDFETRGKDDASRYDARRMSSNYRYGSNIDCNISSTGGKENTDHQIPQKQRYEESDDNKNQDSTPPPLEPREAETNDGYGDCSDYHGDEENHDFRGINYCLHNSEGVVEQSNAKEGAIRSILDFVSTRLDRDVVFEDVTISAGTSFRYGNSDEITECLRLASEAWTSAYESHRQNSYLSTMEELSKWKLYELIAGAALYHSINISMYDVESNECFEIFHPPTAEQALVLTQYANLESIDLKFSHYYINYDKLLWSLDTNNFNCNNTGTFQFLLQSVFDEVLANIDSYSVKDHIWGVLRLVPLHLINTEEARARILGRFLPAKFDWCWWMATNSIHPSDTPPKWVDYMVEAYEDARKDGKLDPSGGGAYARLVSMEDLSDHIDWIKDQAPPPVPGGNSAYSTNLAFIEKYEDANRGEDPDENIRPVFLSYVGESINILERWRQENNLSKIDGAKLNWMISYFFGPDRIKEIMIAHASEGTSTKFECLLLEGLALTIQVGAARLGGYDDYRALASSGDGINVMNGGRAWLNDVSCIGEIVSWLVKRSRLFPNELVMSSSLVPEHVREYFEYHELDISRFWMETSPQNISVHMLHKYVSSKGGKGEREEKSSEARPIVENSNQSRDSPKSTQQLLPKEILNRLRHYPREQAPLFDNNYHKYCRTEELLGGQWNQCQSRENCEGYCAKHYGIYEQLLGDDNDEWKLHPQPRGHSMIVYETQHVCDVFLQIDPQFHEDKIPLLTIDEIRAAKEKGLCPLLKTFSKDKVIDVIGGHKRHFNSWTDTNLTFFRSNVFAVMCHNEEKQAWKDIEVDPDSKAKLKIAKALAEERCSAYEDFSVFDARVLPNANQRPLLAKVSGITHLKRVVGNFMCGWGDRSTAGLKTAIQNSGGLYRAFTDEDDTFGFYIGITPYDCKEEPVADADERIAAIKEGIRARTGRCASGAGGNQVKSTWHWIIYDDRQLTSVAGHGSGPNAMRNKLSELTDDKTPKQFMHGWKRRSSDTKNIGGFTIGAFNKNKDSNDTLYNTIAGKWVMGFDDKTAKTNKLNRARVEELA